MSDFVYEHGDLTQDEWNKRLRELENSGHIPIRDSNRGVVYVYKVLDARTREFKGQYVDLRFAMGTAPDEWEWDYGREVLKRVYTAPGVQFKGKGWASKS